jgi:hypothetical protein
MDATPRYSRPAYVGVVLLNILLLSPMLDCGYTSDDRINSFIRGTLKEQNTDLWEHSAAQARTWVVDHGRLFPLSAYCLPLFAILPNLLAYRWLGLALVLLDVRLFARLIGRLTGSRNLELLSALCVPALFQFRLYHDGVLSFGLLMPVLFLMIVGSLHLFVSYLHTGRTWALVFSAICYAAALLTYEISYPLCLLHVLLSYGFAGVNRQRLRRAAPFVLLTILAMSGSLLLRSRQNMAIYYTGAQTASRPYVPNPDPKAYPLALCQQTFAALPLSYTICDADNMDVLGTLPQGLSGGALVAGAGCCILAFVLLRRRAEDEAQRSSAQAATLGSGGLLALGAALTVLPGTLMTLSPKYQDELRWGIGYIPVFFSCFGVATMLLAGIRLVRGRPALALVVAVLLGTSGALTFAANRQVVERINRDLRYPRELVEEGMRRGLAPCLLDGSTLVIPEKQGWLTPDTASSFFRQHARAHLEVSLPGRLLGRSGMGADTSGVLAREFTADERVYYLEPQGRSVNEGHVVLARLERLTVTENEVLGAAARRLYLYVRLPRDRSEFWLSGEWLDCETGEHSGRFVINRRHTISVGGVGWSLCQVDAPPGFLFDVHSLDVRTDPISLPAAVPSGFKEKSDLLLGDRSDALLHVGLRGGTVGGLPLRPVTLGESFTIEVLLRPFGQQPAMATVLGNIPGMHDHQGFSLRHPGVANSDRYELIYGDGEVWHKVGDFALPPGRWSHMAVVLDGRSVAIHINGEEAFRNDSLPASFRDSDTPLCLGNALGRDQPFHGVVEEVRIIGRVMGQDEIATAAERALRGRR